MEECWPDICLDYITFDQIDGENNITDQSIQSSNPLPNQNTNNSSIKYKDKYVFISSINFLCFSLQCMIDLINDNKVIIVQYFKN